MMSTKINPVDQTCVGTPVPSSVISDLSQVESSGGNRQTVMGQQIHTSVNRHWLGSCGHGSGGSWSTAESRCTGRRWEELTGPSSAMLLELLPCRCSCSVMHSVMCSAM